MEYNVYTLIGSSKALFTILSNSVVTFYESTVIACTYASHGADCNGKFITTEVTVDTGYSANNSRQYLITDS